MTIRVSWYQTVSIVDFMEAKDDKVGSYKKCKAPVKSSPRTNLIVTQLSTGWMPFLSPSQQSQSTEGRKYHIPQTCLPQPHLEVFRLCLWPLIAPGNLGEGCHAPRQPSDASTLTVKALKGENITFHGLAHLKLTWSLSTLSLTTKGSWLPCGGRLPSISSALWRQYTRTRPNLEHNPGKQTS